MGDDAPLLTASSTARLAETPCPSCGEAGGLSIGSVFVAASPTSSAVAGVQLKTQARMAPVVECPCGRHVVGAYDGAHVTFNPEQAHDG